ncbi:MAG: DUF126 domain-containing protein [Hyphomicrobiales bacterium]|nr:DUF126 domain-containing protein [Hyphomicrobiales bacterium]OQW82165.1 MAG: hypothetical protein BVN31_09210 [Proteobacteria bacterium ST_bin15]
MTSIAARTLFPGNALGEVICLAQPLSFWGGFDPHTGLVMDRWHPDHGRSLGGKILVMSAGRGSSSSSTVLAEALRLGTAPAAFILTSADSILLTGALVASALYGKACPMAVVSSEGWPMCTRHGTLRVQADDVGTVISAPA